jgi:hypothetical protein
MAIDEADVWAYLPKSADRSQDTAAAGLMKRIVDAVEAHWLAHWSWILEDDDGVLPNPRPAYVDLALIIPAAKLYDDRKTPGGVAAGTIDFGPFRVNAFHPDVEALLGPYPPVVA